MTLKIRLLNYLEESDNFRWAGLLLITIGIPTSLAFAVAGNFEIATIGILFYILGFIVIAQPNI